jgi:predicted CoA-binding protein
VVYRRLRQRGLDTVAINPNTTSVEGDRCYPNLRAVPGGVQAVIIGTHPDRASDTVRECVQLGIQHIWMHSGLGAGSVSAPATALAREHGLLVIDGGCPCMFGATADPFHRFLKLLHTAGGSLPRDVPAVSAQDTR